MADVRPVALSSTRRVVVKVGSGLLADWGASLDRAIARRVVDQVCDCLEGGRQIVLVSSGAVALGCEHLGLDERPEDMPTLQAAAAIGQGDLVALYSRALASRGRFTAQVLLTHADLADRRRFLNARHALQRMLELGALPILNENDSVAVEELKVGDNDNLAAQVANLVEADLLVILTDQEGLLTADPRTDPGATRIPVVEAGGSVPDGALGNAAGSLSIGGMATKVEAARKAAARGVPTVVANGRQPGILAAVLGGEDVGTLFLPAITRLGSRQAWIAGLRPLGTLRIDAGAADALVQENRSLLPAGILAVDGDFQRGEPVGIVGEDGAELARGLSAYSAGEVALIRGRRSSEIAALLGYHLGQAVVHRDDLVLTGS